MDFQQTIDRLRSDNVVCQTRLDVLVEANKQRRHVPPADLKRETDVHESSHSELPRRGNTESHEGYLVTSTLAQVRAPSPGPGTVPDGNLQEVLARLRSDFDNSQVHASAADAALHRLWREFNTMKDQIFLQSLQTQTLVEDLRRDVDSLRSSNHSKMSSDFREVNSGAEGFEQSSATIPSSWSAAGAREVQELRSEIVDLKEALQTMGLECRRTAPASVCIEAQQRAACDPGLQHLQAEVQGLRAEVQRLDRESAPLMRSISALWIEVESFKVANGILGPTLGKGMLERTTLPMAESQETLAEPGFPKVLAVPRLPVVEHSTLDSTEAREDLLRALQVVREMQELASSSW